MMGAVRRAAIILAFATLGTLARADGARQPIILPEGFQYPNGIAAASDGSIYVGSVTSGTILKIASDGGTETVFAGSPDVFAGTVLRLDEGRGLLWGASPDFLGQPQPDGTITRRPHRIFALNLATRTIAKVILMPNAGFGNDLAIDTQGGVYVTDSVRDRVLYWAPGEQTLRVHVEGPALGADGQGLAGIGPAGIALSPDGQTLVAGIYGTGQLLRIDASGRDPRMRSSTNGRLSVRAIWLLTPPTSCCVKRNHDEES